MNQSRNFCLSLIGLSLAIIFSSSCVNSSAIADKKFNIAMKTVLRHEGGLSHDKNDAGGWTRYGISLRFLKSEHLDVNGDGVVNQDDVIHLTATEADQIYYQEWYEKYHYNRISNQSVLTKIMDFSVNAGASQCHKLVKRAINELEIHPIKVDGTLDNKTITIINALKPSVFHEVMVEEEEEFYRGIVKRTPHLRVFLSGWMKRAED